MGFFSRLFGLDKPEEDSNNNDFGPRAQKTPLKKGNPFFTNAPEHWPVITDEFLTSNENFSRNFDDQTGDHLMRKRMFMVNSLVLLGSINQSFADKLGRKVLSSYADELLNSDEEYATTCCIAKRFKDRGILTNGIAIENGKRYAVFLFDQPTPMSYVDELKNYFLADGFVDVIYYALDDPKAVVSDRKLVLENLTD
jgi:hypothetical protein